MNRKGETANPEGYKDITHEEFQFEDNDALNLEVLDFLGAIREGRAPIVSGEDGRRALETAIAITRLIQAGR